MAEPPNPPSGDEPPRTRSWYPAPTSPRATPRPSTGPAPDDKLPGRASPTRPPGAVPPGEASPVDERAPTEAAPGGDAPGTGQPGSGQPISGQPGTDRPATEVPVPGRPGNGSGPPAAGSELDSTALPPVPPRPVLPSNTRRDRRSAADPLDPALLFRPRRKWPWIAGVVIVSALLLLAGVFYRDRNAATGPLVTGPAQSTLVGSAAVPADLRNNCRGITPTPKGAIAALRCSPSQGPSKVTYTQYGTPQKMSDAFDARIARSRVSKNAGLDCARAVGVENTYDTAQNASGTVACFRENGHSVIVWTMPALSTLGVAQRDDSQDQPLYDWWNVAYQVNLNSDASAPATLTAGQAALLTHVPSPVSPTCQATTPLENATASLVCLSGDTDVYYTSYASADAMNAVYQAQRTSAKVASDSGLATLADCPGEGAYRVGTADAGRFLCFTAGSSARATWTDNQFSILTEAVRTDNQFRPFAGLAGQLGPS